MAVWCGIPHRGTRPPGSTDANIRTGGAVASTAMRDFTVDRTASMLIMPLAGSSMHISASSRPDPPSEWEPAPDAEFRLGHTGGKSAYLSHSSRQERCVPRPDAESDIVPPRTPRPAPPSRPSPRRLELGCGIPQPIAGLDGERSVHAPVLEGWGLSSVGQAQPDQGSAGGATGENPARARTAVVAGCAPGRSLIASGARARRDPNPAPTTPQPPTQRTRSLSEGGPAGGALDLDVPRPTTRRREPTRRQRPPAPRVKDAEGGTPKRARGAQRRRADAQTHSNHQRPANPRRGPARSAAKHRDVGGQQANRTFRGRAGRRRGSPRVSYAANVAVDDSGARKSASSEPDDVPGERG